MTEKRFTRAEVNKFIHDVRIHYYKMYGDEMSLSERLFYADICETIENQVDYKMELLEKDEAIRSKYTNYEKGCDVE